MFKLCNDQLITSGTQERVCIISGSLRAVIELEKFFIEKILEKQDPNRVIDSYDYKNTERGKEVSCVPFQSWVVLYMYNIHLFS